MNEGESRNAEEMVGFVLGDVARALGLPPDTPADRIMIYLGQVVRVARDHFGMPMPVWTAEDAVSKRIEELERVKFQHMDPRESIRRVREMGIPSKTIPPVPTYDLARAKEKFPELFRKIEGVPDAMHYEVRPFGERDAGSLKPLAREFRDMTPDEIPGDNAFAGEVVPATARDLAPQCQTCKHWHFPNQPCM